jgi:integral membrane protein
VNAALTRYRVLAYVVGAVLVTLTLVAMPRKYIFDDATLVETIGPAHGFLYMGLMLATADLARRLRWDARRTVLVLLGGTVPFVSFLVERRVTQEVRRTQRDTVALKP